MNVIETNLSCDNDWKIKDHQSRVLEISSWQNYINLFEYYDGIANGKDLKCLTPMYGSVMPNKAMIVGLEYDEFHLKCELKLWNNMNEIKLAYLVR
mgnify:CR=1 FL=1